MPLTTRFIALFLACCFSTAAMAAPTSPAKVFRSFKLTSQGDDGNWYPIIGFDDRRPLIAAKSGIGPAKINWMKAAPTSSINDIAIEVIKMEQVERPNQIVLDFTARSSQPLQDAYATLTFKFHGDNGRSWAGAAVCRTPLPPLTGEPQSLRLVFDNAKGNIRDGEWELRFYHFGVELYNTARTDLQDASPEQAFSLALSRRQMAVGSGDAPLAPFYMPLSKVDDKLLPRGNEPVTVKVQITVNAEGRITAHKFDGKVSKKLREHLAGTFPHWLLLPAMKEGKAVTNTVKIPLKLR
ncbi:MAG: hypothetical protein SynsKO_25430 [Synoicihabitans sp.]